MLRSKKMLFTKPGDYELNFSCCNSIERTLGLSLLPPRKIKAMQAGEIVLVIAEAGIDYNFLEEKLLNSRAYAFSKLFNISGDQEFNRFYEQLESISKGAASYIQKYKRSHVSVLIDGIPAVNENFLFELSARLRKIAEIGCRVVIVAEPEAMCLRKEIPEAIYLNIDALLYRMPSSKNVAAKKAMSLTQGLPSLVKTLSEGQEHRCQHYAESLQCIIKKTLHYEATGFQLYLRFAMMLMGSGSFDELSQIIPEIDDDCFAQLQSQSPFFGIDIYHSTFKCAGIFDDNWFNVVFESMHTVAHRLNGICEQACEVLARRGDFRRAGICCSLCGPTDLRCRQALKWGVEFCIAGVLEVVVDSLLQADELSMDNTDGYLESEIALFTIGGLSYQKKWFPRAFRISEVGSLAFRVRLRHLQLLENIRGMDSGVPSGSVAFLFGVDGLSKAMLDHIELESLLLSGYFSQAEIYLSNSWIKQCPSTIPDALLVRDAALTLSFVGVNLAPKFKSAIACAHQLIESSHLRRLICYERAAAELLDILSGSSKIRQLEQAVCCAEREGDSVTQSVFLLACAVGAMRGGSLVGAHVRAKKAYKISLSSSQVYLSQCALFIDAIICDLLGEKGSLQRLLQMDKLKGMIKDLANMLVEIGCDELKQCGHEIPSRHFYIKIFRVLSPASLPQDIWWLISFLKDDCGYVSTVFRTYMPQAWKSTEKSKLITSGWEEAWYLGNVGGVSVADKKLAVDSKPQESLAKQQESSEKKCFYFSMLGGFAAFVKGSLIETERLNFRHARTLLGLLVAKEDHIMHRAEIVNLVWPGVDTKVAMQKLCEAISGARKILAVKKLKADVFVCNKLDKTVGLNPETVLCDVDQFIEKVFKTKKQEGANEVVVGLACEARDLYRGDLDCKVVNDVQEVQDRRDILKMAFADVMVAGARAALENRKIQLSVQLAQESYITQPYREDTIAILIESLCATGRRFEANKILNHYCADFVNFAGMQPSEELRRILMKMISSGACSLETRRECSRSV